MTALRRVLDRLGGEGLLVDPLPDAVQEVTITGLADDSRDVRPGALFCAVCGTEHDGHDYLDRAVAAGAVAALVERVIPEHDIPQIRVEDGRAAVAFAAAELHGDPWARMEVVGITGTNGKTTTAAILHHAFNLRGPAASIGTLGIVGPDRLVIPGTEGLTTPGPVGLAFWFERLLQQGIGRVSMEVSSHALDQERVAAVRFDAALFTNLSRDHLDYHETFEAYRAAKLRLVGLLKPGGVLALNADDAAWKGVHAEGDGRTVRFGLRPGVDVSAEDLQYGRHGVAWTLRTPGGHAEVELPLYGAYNVSNALGAAAVLWGLGWDPGAIAEAFRDLPHIVGRLERVPGPQGAPTVLIDYAHTPDALERALSTLRPLVPGKLIVVFGAGGDRDRGKRPEMGRIAAACADLSVVTSDNPRHEDPEKIADDIESGMGNAPRRRILDRRDAILHAIRQASEADCVLLAGKGHETYQIWGSERRPFDERTVVRDIFLTLYPT